MGKEKQDLTIQVPSYTHPGWGFMPGKVPLLPGRQGAFAQWSKRRENNQAPLLGEA